MFKRLSIYSVLPIRRGIQKNWKIQIQIVGDVEWYLETAKCTELVTIYSPTTKQHYNKRDYWNIVLWNILNDAAMSVVKYISIQRTRLDNVAITELKNKISNLFRIMPMILSSVWFERLNMVATGKSISS